MHMSCDASKQHKQCFERGRVAHHCHQCRLGPAKFFHCLLFGLNNIWFHYYNRHRDQRLHWQVHHDCLSWCQRGWNQRSGLQMHERHNVKGTYISIKYFYNFEYNILNPHVSPRSTAPLQLPQIPMATPTYSTASSAFHGTSLVLTNPNLCLYSTWKIYIKGVPLTLGTTSSPGTATTKPQKVYSKAPTP
jgi:hypothetical protein